MSFIDGLIVAREQLSGDSVTIEAPVGEPGPTPSMAAVPSGYAAQPKAMLPQLYVSLKGEVGFVFPLKKQKSET